MSRTPLHPTPAGLWTTLSRHWSGAYPVIAGVLPVRFCLTDATEIAPIGQLATSPAPRDPGWRPEREGRALHVLRDDGSGWVGQGVESWQVHVSIHDVHASWPHEPPCTPRSGLHWLEAEPEAFPSSAVRPDQAERPPVQVPRAVAAFDGERPTPDAHHGTARPAIPLVPSRAEGCMTLRIQR